MILKWSFIFFVQNSTYFAIREEFCSELGNEINENIFLSDKIRAERSRYFMRLVLVRQRDKLDILFRHYLCEDKAAPGASGASIDNFSYVDFLCHMHKEIRALLG